MNMINFGEIDIRATCGGHYLDYHYFAADIQVGGPEMQIKDVEKLKVWLLKKLKPV